MYILIMLENIPSNYLVLIMSSEEVNNSVVIIY